MIKWSERANTTLCVKVCKPRLTLITDMGSNKVAQGSQLNDELSAWSLYYSSTFSVRQHKKKQSWCNFLFTQMKIALQARGSSKTKTIYIIRSKKMQENVRLPLVLRFENGATNRQQNIFNVGDTAQQICHVLVLCLIVGLLIIRLAEKVF